MATTKAAVRSVRDATRFTALTPHATCKSSFAASSPAARSSPSSSSSSSPSPLSSSSPGRAGARTVGGGAKPAGGGGGGAGVGGGGGGAKIQFVETPEQRVARLRAAHDAARRAQMSRVDQVVATGRKLADSAHRITLGIIFFVSVTAAIFTVVAIVDMTRHNMQRRKDFQQAVSQYQQNSLEAARLAFIDGTATDEQVALVERANRAAEESGTRLPPLLSKPQPSRPEEPRQAPELRFDDASAASSPSSSSWQGSSSGSAKTEGAGPGVVAEGAGGGKTGKSWWRFW